MQCHDSLKKLVLLGTNGLYTAGSKVHNLNGCIVVKFTSQLAFYIDAQRRPVPSDQTAAN